MKKRKKMAHKERKGKWNIAPFNKRAKKAMKRSRKG